MIDTLEAIRLFLSAPKTAFVIGADEDLIHHAVERRFPEARGVRPNVGRDYLEKLVQIPIWVPPLGRGEIETYMALLFADLHTGDDFAALLDALRDWEGGGSQMGHIDRFDRTIAKEILKPCPDELDDDLLLVQQTGDVLTSGLDGNPRQTKRFLNTLLLRTTMAASRGVELRRRPLAKAHAPAVLQDRVLSGSGWPPGSTGWAAHRARRRRGSARGNSASLESTTGDDPKEGEGRRS